MKLNQAEQRRPRRIDVHAHLLPGVDDGARSVEEACRLVGKAEAAGFDTIIVTPHYSRRRGTEGLLETFEQLKQEVARQHPAFTLYLGHETYYHEELPERLRAGQAFTMAGSRYVLVEFDSSVSFQTLNRAMHRLLTAGYIPVIAHMERYRCLREKKNLDEIRACGCLMQMNYESLAGNWLSPEVRWCRNQVKEGKIHFLGTDMHRINYRPPEIAESVAWLEKHVDETTIRKLTFRNARKMIQNEKIEN